MGRVDSKRFNHFNNNPWTTPVENAERSGARLLARRPLLYHWVFSRTITTPKVQRTSRDLCPGRVIKTVMIRNARATTIDTIIGTAIATTMTTDSNPRIIIIIIITKACGAAIRPPNKQQRLWLLSFYLILAHFQTEWLLQSQT